MKRALLGRSGASLPRVGLGTVSFEELDQGQVDRLVHRALELGLSHIDTAEGYGDGRVEQLVGRAIRGRRSDAFLATKVLPEHAGFSQTISACERSLERLGTDYIDLYLLHFPATHPIEETLRAFDVLQVQGKIHHFGVSNFNLLQLRRAVRTIGRNRISCNQVHYSLARRTPELAMLPWCRRNGVSLVAYSPFDAGARLQVHSPGQDTLDKIATSHGLNVAQLILNYLLDGENVFAIPRTIRSDHLQHNAHCLDERLTKEEIRAISATFPILNSRRLKNVPGVLYRRLRDAISPK